MLIATLSAQAPLAVSMGVAEEIAPDHIALQTGSGRIVLYSDAGTRIWRGQESKTLTTVQPGDKVLARYRPDSTHPVIVDLFANITHVWGRISAVDPAGFLVDQNFNADPQSAYRRITRRIDLNSDTRFEASARDDLRVGRTVDIIGLETDADVQATRIIVYEGNAPVRMAPDAILVAPNGSIRRAR